MNVQNEDLIRYLEQFPPEAEVQTVLVGFEQQKFYSADCIFGWEGIEKSSDRYFG